MDPDRLAAIVAGLDVDRDAGVDIGVRLCTICVDVLEVTGAGIMLMIDGEHSSSLGVSDRAIGVVEDLQFTLGVGPCIDAFRSGEAVHEPDLADPAVARWPGFSGPALDAGVRAVFGFPVASAAVPLGALDLYLDHPGSLSTSQVADAAALTDVISRTVLEIQANTAPGTVAGQFEAGVDHRAVVHQASGMVSAQLDEPVADALDRIRAYAYAEDIPINDVARDIVERVLRLDAGTDR